MCLDPPKYNTFQIVKLCGCVHIVCMLLSCCCSNQYSFQPAIDPRSTIQSRQVGKCRFCRACPRQDRGNACRRQHPSMLLLAPCSSWHKFQTLTSVAVCIAWGQTPSMDACAPSHTVTIMMPSSALGLQETQGGNRAASAGLAACICLSDGAFGAPLARGPCLAALLWAAPRPCCHVCLGPAG